MKEWDPKKPMSTEMEGLMRLKYEAEDPTGMSCFQNNNKKKCSESWQI